MPTVQQNDEEPGKTASKPGKEERSKERTRERERERESERESAFYPPSLPTDFTVYIFPRVSFELISM